MIPPKYPFVVPQVKAVWNVSYKVDIKIIDNIELMARREVRLTENWAFYQKFLTFFLNNIQLDFDLGESKMLDLIEAVDDYASKIVPFEERNSNTNEYTDSLKLILGENFCVLDLGKIATAQNKQVSEISQRLNIQTSGARNLLATYKWDSSLLLKEYKTAKSFDQLEEYFKSSGITYPIQKDKDIDFEEEIECPICIDDFKLEDMVAVGCKHFFCRSCYEKRLMVQITESGASADFIKCPGYKCNQVIDDCTTISLLSRDLFTKWSAFVIQAYVDKHNNIKWCPGTSCQFAVQSQSPTCNSTSFQSASQTFKTTTIP